jgi:late competence protein required for DNA uptake (superfamily II DNA/RNA helicase)
MTLARIDWAAMGNLPSSELLPSIFGIMRDAALAINSGEPDDPAVLQVIPRLADIIPSRPELSPLLEPFSALARAVGLWNYIDRATADQADRLVAEAVTAPELGGITFHREQVAALNKLLSGENLILSAPTSFGKSLLIDALLATGRFERIAIVLPTIALLDEFRRRLRRRFSDRFEILMHPTDAAIGRNVIFLGTQERLIGRDDLGSLDLTVVDEFYKLDPQRKDERHVTLNAAVYRLLRRSRQFFFLGPNIDNVHMAVEGRWSFQFLKTRFSTVAVDTFDLRQVEDKEARLLEELAEEKNWPALVFVSSPDRANKLADTASQKMAVSDYTTEFANWLRVNVGKRWPLAKAVEFGFGVHHARVPRAIASHMVRMFNQSELPVLFCTSTLIEGVNTAARSVLIYDKKISRQNYDFFTFANIRGRAGRLGQHHVGQVYLFNEPPPVAETDVSPTLFGDDENASDDYVVHLEEEDTTTAIDDRVAALRQSLDLTTAQLRIASAVGLEIALALKQQVDASLRSSGVLAWSGLPDYNTTLATLDVICKVKSARDFGAFSNKQLAFQLGNLRAHRTLRSFLIEHDQSFQGDLTAYDNIFKFLRACEYGLPQLFALVEIFVRRRFPRADYSFFVREMSRWFRNEALRNLDEEGVPIQIAERFLQPGDDRNSLARRLAEVAIIGGTTLTTFERAWLLAALDIDSNGQILAPNAIA